MVTNYEYFKDAIINLVSVDNSMASSLAVLDGEPCRCSGMPCSVCDLYDMGGTRCAEKRKMWLNAEHIEKPKLTKKERQFCELVETGWITRDADGRLEFRNNKPRKNPFNCHWTYDGGPDEHILVVMKKMFPNLKFSFITWDDKEPWSVEDLLKLEYERSEDLFGRKENNNGKN